MKVHFVRNDLQNRTFWVLVENALNVMAVVEGHNEVVSRYRAKDI